MNVKSEIKKLQQNKMLRNSDEINSFELAIKSIVSMNDVKLIKDLCSGFDDQTEDHEIMFGLVHAIESFDSEDGLLEMAKTIPSMLIHAKEWATILNYRVLNHEPSRKSYIKILSSVDPNVKNSIIELITEIRDEDPVRFEKVANEVLSNVV